MAIFHGHEPAHRITWAESSAEIFEDVGMAFRLTFLNKCDVSWLLRWWLIYQRVLASDLPESAANVVLG